MIRAGGVLAVVAGAAILFGLLHATRSAVLVGTVTSGREPTDRGIALFLDPNSISLPEGYGNFPGLPFWQEARQDKDFYAVIVTLVEAPGEVIRTAREGDTLTVRAHGLWWPTPVSWPIHARYELRQPDGTVVVNGPGNGKFLMTWGVAIAAPILLWGLAAVIVAIAPGSPERR